MKTGLLVLACAVLIAGGCGATPTPAPASAWAAIVAAYVGPDGQPSDQALRESFVKIMGIADTVVQNRENYTADERARAQAIFDAAANAHAAITGGDYDLLAVQWQSLGRFVAWLQDAGH